MSQDAADFMFRVLFSLIFLGLGAEHLFSDALIQHLMPDWVPLKRFVSIACGMWLVAFGSLILFGVCLRIAALGLALFLVAVTAAVHVPGVLSAGPDIPAEALWMWDILQRSNLVKNLCLLGVCCYLPYHEPKRYSLAHWLRRNDPV